MFPQPSKMKGGKKKLGRGRRMYSKLSCYCFFFCYFFSIFPITLSYIKNIFKVFLLSWECGAVKGFLWRNYRQHQLWIYWSSFAVLRKPHWVAAAAAPARISGKGAGLLKDRSLTGMHWLSNISKGDGFHLATTLSDKRYMVRIKLALPTSHTHYTFRCIDGVEGARFSSAGEVRSNHGKVIITSHQQEMYGIHKHTHSSSDQHTFFFVFKWRHP